MAAREKRRHYVFSAKDAWRHPSSAGKMREAGFRPYSGDLRDGTSENLNIYQDQDYKGNGALLQGMVCHPSMKLVEPKCVARKIHFKTFVYLRRNFSSPIT